MVHFSLLPLRRRREEEEEDDVFSLFFVLDLLHPLGGKKKKRLQPTPKEKNKELKGDGLIQIDKEEDAHGVVVVVDVCVSSTSARSQANRFRSTLLFPHLLVKKKREIQFDIISLMPEEEGRKWPEVCHNCGRSSLAF